MAKINTIKTPEEKKERKSFIEKFTGLALFMYIISTIAFEGAESTKGISSVTLYLFLFSAIIYIFYKKRVTINYYIIATVCYGAFLYFSYFYAIDQVIGMQTLYWYFTCVILTIFVINYVDTNEKINLVLYAYIVGGLVLCIFAYKTYGMEIFNIVKNSERGIRVGSELGNENSIGISCVLSLLFSFYIMLYTNLKKRYYPFFIANIIACFTFAMLTGSKKALILVLFGTLYLFIFKNNGKRFSLGRFMMNLIIGSLIIFLIIYVLQNVKTFWYVNERMQELFGTFFGGKKISASDKVRITMMKTGWEAFLRHPFIGNGVAASRYVFGTYSHNNLIEILMNTGVIGFGLYYSSYYISFKRLFQNEFKNNSFTKLAFLLVVSIFVLEFGLVTYYARSMQILLAVISAFIGMNYITKRDKGLYNGQD